MDIRLYDQKQLDERPEDRELFRALKPSLAELLDTPILEVNVDRFLMKLLWNARPSRKEALLERLQDAARPLQLEEKLAPPDPQKMVRERMDLLESGLPHLQESWEALAPIMHQLLEPIPPERINYHLLGWLVSEVGWPKRHQFLNNQFYPYLLEHHQMEPDFAETILRRWWSNRERALKRILDDPPNWLFRYPAGVLTPATEHEDPEVRQAAIRLAGRMEGGLMVPSRNTATRQTP